MKGKTLMGRSEMRRLFPEAEKAAQALASTIGSGLPPGYGFALLVFAYGEDGYLTHVSSCERADLIKLLRETADVMERGGDSSPGIVGQTD